MASLSHLSNLSVKLGSELKTKEAKLYKALDKIEAVIQHNESPIETWSENEYQLIDTPHD